MFIINSIAPIFLLIALGAVFRKTRFLPEEFFKGINRFVFWIALPALLVGSIGSAEIEPQTVSRIVLVLALASVLCLALAWGAAKGLQLPPPKTGSFIQGSFRSNCAFIGLPLIIYILGELDPRAEMLGTVVLAPVVILFNMLSVFILLHYRSKPTSTAESLRTIFVQLAKNPLILACLAGLALNLFGITLPRFLDRSFNALGNSALPLILLSIGSSLGFERLRGTASPALMASLIKVVAAPAIGFLLVGLFHLDATERMIAILYLACPAAGSSYVMAEVMGADGPLAGRIVALSTLLSAITLPIVIAIGLK